MFKLRLGFRGIEVLALAWLLTIKIQLPSIDGSITSIFLWWIRRTGRFIAGTHCKVFKSFLRNLGLRSKLTPFDLVERRLVTSWIVSLIYGLAYGSSFARARDLVATHVEEGVDMEAVLEAWCLGDKLKVTDVYEDIQEHGDLVRWHRVVWASIDTPKHEFVLWLAVLGKLSIYDRLFYLNVDHVCRICDDDEVESLDHFFFRFPYLKYIWENVRARF